MAPASRRPASSAPASSASPSSRGRQLVARLMPRRHRSAAGARVAPRRPARWRRHSARLASARASSHGQARARTQLLSLYASSRIPPRFRVTSPGTVALPRACSPDTPPRRRPSAEEREDQLGKAEVQAVTMATITTMNDQRDGRVHDQLPPGRPDHLAELADALAEEQRGRSPAFGGGLGTAPFFRPHRASEPPCPTYAALTVRIVQGRRDSNPQPPVLETGTLPIELLPYGEPTG